LNGAIAGRLRQGFQIKFGIGWMRISYELREYAVDPQDLAAETVAAKLGFPAACSGNPHKIGRFWTTRRCISAFPKKPKGMHWRTYERLCAQAQAADQQSWGWFLARMGARFGF